MNLKEKQRFEKEFPDFFDWGGQHQFLPFMEAREFVHSLGLKSVDEWRKYCKSGDKPEDIPANPWKVYREWIGCGDWLGNEKLPFEEARGIVQSLGLKCQREWIEFCASGERPHNIPASPENKYKEWTGYGDWLGTGTISPQNMVYRPFEKAREFSRKLKLKKKDDWICYAKSNHKPSDIPASPSKTYRGKGWVSWKDWLGTNYRLFEEARKFIRSLKLESWKRYVKSGQLPEDIPKTPWSVYSDWRNMADWLGRGKISGKLKEWLDFESARKIARSLGLENQAAWASYCKSVNFPPDLPTNPQRTYVNCGWIGYGDWLGNGNIAPRYMKYRPFTDAREFVHSLQIPAFRGTGGWMEYCASGNKPPNIPSNPNHVYRNKGWISWPNWLGQNKT